MAEQSYEIKKIKIIESLDKIQIECTNTRDAGKDDLKGIFSEKAAPDDNAAGTFFTPTTEKRLWALEAEARKYLCGKRAQTSLFDGDTAGQANDETEQSSGGAHVIPFGGAAREA